jgi:acetyl-CoA synthetase
MQDQYAALYSNFRWHVPQRFNIAQACLSRWARAPAHAQRVAIHAESARGERTAVTFAELKQLTDRLSHALASLRVRQGDRVAIVMPQRVETAAAHFAVYQLGAVAMPLSMLFGPEALEYRLRDSEACVAIADESSIDNLLACRQACPQLRHVVTVGDAQGRGDVDWPALIAGARGPFRPVTTSADDPAVLIYTSGTTGPPKGALIPHRALIGNLPGFVASQNWFPQPGDVFWSPADWAWTGGLMDALLPSLYFGMPIVGFNGRFQADSAFELMQRYRVTNTFLFPTALKQMMKAFPEPRRHFRLTLRAIMSAGEAVGDAVYGYTREALGVTLNEMFGQTEINYIVGNSHARWPSKPGSMGRAYPGHRIAVIDEQGRELPPGECGEVAVHRRDRHGDPDPVFFLGYWRNDAATRRKFTGAPDDSWCRTGDMAIRDRDGYLWYQGRSDDVFKVSGYRVGPSEIENCLVKHPAVANAAVVPKPDADKGHVVKAFIVLQPGVTGDAALIADIQRHVRGQLAPYEYPREIVFTDALPMTTTGKIQRRLLKG